jgi:very-short-patch-repair endonuclease
MKRSDFLKRLETEVPRNFSLYNYDLIPDVFKSTQKVSINCDLHGIFDQLPHSHLAGNGCPNCKGIKLALTTETFIERAKSVHGLRFDYSDVEYTTNSEKVKIICSEHGAFRQRAADHLLGSICPKCAVNERSSKRALTREEFIERAVARHGDRYGYNDVAYINSETPVKIHCQKHGIFEQRADAHIQGSGCYRCRQSRGENQIETFLRNRGINFLREYRLNDQRYFYDFYLPDQNILIEFHGIQHYFPVDFFGGVAAYEDTVRRDELKKALAEKNNIPMITISYLRMNDLESALRSSLKCVKPFWIFKSGVWNCFKNAAEVRKFLGIEKMLFNSNIVNYLNLHFPELEIL